MAEPTLDELEELGAEDVPTDDELRELAAGPMPGPAPQVIEPELPWGRKEDGGDYFSPATAFTIAANRAASAGLTPFVTSQFAPDDKSKEEWRQLGNEMYAQAEGESPISSFAGNLVGSVVSPPARIAGKLLGKAGLLKNLAVREGVASGATSGFGESLSRTGGDTAQEYYEAVRDATIGGVTGGATGYGMSKASNIPEWLRAKFDKMADIQAGKMLDPKRSSSQVRAAQDRSVRDTGSVDSSVEELGATVRPYARGALPTTGSLAKDLSGEISKQGKAREEALDALAPSIGNAYSINRVAGELLKEAEKYKTIDVDLSAALRKRAVKIFDEYDEMGKAGYGNQQGLGPKEMRERVSQAQARVNWAARENANVERVPSIVDATEAKLLRKEFRSTTMAVAQETGDDSVIETARKALLADDTMAKLSGPEDIAIHSATLASNRSAFGLPESFAMSGGLVAGYQGGSAGALAGGIAAPVVMSTARKYGRGANMRLMELGGYLSGKMSNTGAAPMMSRAAAPSVQQSIDNYLNKNKVQQEDDEEYQR